MIFKPLILTINRDKTSLDEPVYLYKGDGGICLCVKIRQAKYKFGNHLARTETLDLEYAHSCEVYVLGANKQLRLVPKAEITENEVHIFIDKEWLNESSEVGKHYVQIVLYDESGESRVTLPPFNFEVLSPIEGEGGSSSDYLTENGIALLSEDGNGIRISELPSTRIGRGYVPVVQDNVTYKYDIGQLSERIDNLENYPVEIPTDIQEELAKLTGATIDYNGNEFETIKEAMDSNIEYLKAYIQEQIEQITGVANLTSTFDKSIFATDEEVVILYELITESYGQGRLYVTIKDSKGVEETTSYPATKGENTVNLGVFKKGAYTITMYAIDSKGNETNPLIFKINVGGLEVTSTFIYNKDYVVTDNIIIPFNVESVFTGQMLYHIEIGGFSYSGTALNGYNSFTVPSEVKTSGVKRVRLWIEQSGNTSKILSFNLIILDSNGILLSSETQEITLEYGYKFDLEYRISTRVVNNVNTIYYVDDEEISSQNLPVGVNSWLIEKVAEGTHTIKIKAFSGDMVALLEIPLTITESDYTPVQHVSSGLTVYFDATIRTNGDSDKETWTSLVADESGEYATANLYGYNYSTNGWVDGALVSPNGTHVEIHHKPLKDNILHGFTFDILYKSRLLDSEDNRVVECIEGDREIGFKITSNKAYLTGDSNNISNEYLDDTYTHITFVVDRYSTYYVDGEEKEMPMCQIYVNGILSCASILTDNGEGADRQYESFLSTSNIFLNASSDGSLNGETSFKKIRVYNRALTHEEVLQNYIADIEDLATQREIYEMNYTLLDQMLPVLYMTDSEIGTHANMTKDNKQYMYIRYSSPDEKKFGESFEYLGRTAWQGTSSLKYPVKNYKFTLYDYSHDEDGNLVVGSKVKVNPYIEGHAEDTFCLKADYMESSHSRNTGTARFVNDVLYKGTASPSKQQDPKSRDTINGFPCLLYVNNQRMGVFNFNHDKSCKKALGFSTIPDFFRFEISANSETTTGAFNKTWEDGDSAEVIYEHILSDYEVAFDEDRAEKETTLDFDVTEYYDELLIPHDEEVVMGTYNDRALLSMARFIKFVSDSTDEEYKARLHEYCDIDRAIRYWINVQMFGMIDNYAKNTFLNCFDGKIFYFAFYDMDSSIGLDNTGYLINTPDIEMMDKKSTGAYVFNCATSRMWSKLFNNFKDEIEEIYTELRNGAFTLESLTKYIVTDQIDRIPARMYNEDQYTKYISQGRQYLHMLHGSNRDCIINWLSYRIHYLDSLIMGIKSPYTSKSITIRSNNPNSDGGGYTATLNILPIRTQYITVKWRNGTFETKRCTGGQVTTYSFDMVNATDNEVLVYCAYNLRDIGSLTNMNPSTIDVGDATNLTQLIAPNCPSLVKADVSKNVKLKIIDFNNCTSLGSELGGAGANILDIKNCSNLKYVDVRNTCINSVITNSIGSTIEKLYLSDKTTNINLINFTNLTDLYIGDGSSLISFNAKGVPFDLSTYIDIILRAEQITIDDCNVGTDLNISNTYNKTTTLKLSNLDINSLTYTHNTSVENPMTTEYYPTVNDFGFKLNLLEIGYMPNLTTLILGKNTENNDNTALGFNNSNAMVFLHDLPQLATINTYVAYVGLNKLILNNELKHFNFKHMTTNNQYGDFGMFNYAHSEDIILPLVTLDTILSQSAYHEDNNRINIVNLKNSDCFISQLNWKSCSLFKYYDNVKKICICPYDIANNRPRNAYDYKIDSTAINTGIYFYSDSLDYPNVDYPLYVHDIDFTNAPLSTSLMTGSHRYLYDNIFTDMSQFDDVKSKMGMIDNTVEFIHDNTFNCGFTLTNENCDNYMPSTSEQPVTINGDVVIESTVLSAIGSFKHTIINGNVIINSVDNVNLTETFYGATINGNVTINCTGEVNLSNAFQNATITGEIVFTSDCLVNAYYMLHGATLDKAPLMPLGTYNIQYAFANSTITKTPNNWSLPYINSEVLKDRTKTYAYQGCSNITSIGTVENWQVVDWVDGSIDNIYTTWGGGTVPPYDKHEYTIELTEDGVTINLETNQNMATEYNEDVDWGDGTVDNESSHTYANAGTYTIKTNKFVGLTDGQHIESVKLSTDNIISYHDTETEQGILGKCPNLTYLDLGAVKINPTYVLNSTIPMLTTLTIDIDCSNLNELSLFAKDKRFTTVTVNVKQVNNTFTLGKFREHGTATVGNLTYDLTSINHEYDLYISEPFVCTGYCNINLNDYAKVKSLYKLVTPHQSTATKSIKIEGGDFTQLTSLNNTFNGLDTTNVSIPNLDMSIITDMSYAFANAKAILDVEDWDMNGVTTVSHMFSGCGRIMSLDLSKWDISTITDMSYLFNDCTALITLDLSNWNTAHVTNMSHMFANCFMLAPLDLYYFDTTSLTTYDNMLMGVYGKVSITARFTLTEEDVSFDGKFIILLIGVFLRYTANASGVVPTVIVMENNAPYVKQETDNGDGTFTVQYANADEYTLTQISFYSKTGLLRVDDMKGNLTDAKPLYTINPTFYGCTNLKYVNLSGITTTGMTDMSRMFYNCKNLTTLDVSNFNTDNVTNMSNMFSNCSKVTTLDVSNFNTEKVTDMSDMFYNCSKLTSLNVSNFNTSLVTSMSSMFSGCSKLTSLDLSNFDTSSVTRMDWMFHNCSSLESLNTSTWDTSKVTDMDYMFNFGSRNTIKLKTLDLSNFTVGSTTEVGSMFALYTTQVYYDSSKFHETPLATVMNQYKNTTFTDVNATANTQAIMELQDDSTMTMMALTELYETTQAQQPMVMSLEEEEPVQTFAMRTTATTVSPFVEAIIPSIYARLIKRGYKTIDDVPYSIREQVETLL